MKLARATTYAVEVVFYKAVRSLLAAWNSLESRLLTGENKLLTRDIIISIDRRKIHIHENLRAVKVTAQVE